MPLFDLAPKERPQALFGREEELAELLRLVRARRWVAVLGPRMVGKTSLVKAAQARLRRPGAYVNLWGVRTFQGLLDGLVHGLGESRSLAARLRGAVGRIDGISVGPGGLSVQSAARPRAAVWDLLDLLGQERQDCLIVLDEVQELGPNSGALLKLLGNIFNTHPNLVFVFTGSKFGVMRTLLEPRSASPLYGRSPVPLELGPFDRSKARAFLRAGAREARVRLSEAEVEQAVSGALDGTPGWLTLLGNHLAVRRLPFAQALQETVREGKRVAEEEVQHFLHGRERELYWPALKACVDGAGWARIKEAMALPAGAPVNDGTVGRVVHGLESGRLVVHEDRVYRLVDPMVREYVRGAPRAP